MERTGAIQVPSMASSWRSLRKVRQGAVREFCDLLLAARGAYAGLLEQYWK